ncbi:hypothetical protein AHAS_Ahas11G0195300 [Arachis hypogaea]
MNEMRKGGIPVSRIHSFMMSLAGGYHNVPDTTRDMHNINAKQRREGGLDAESCISQIDYQVFGDGIAFDATYKKNVYLSPLVVFSGVNYHNQTVVFATALVVDEKEEPMSSCFNSCKQQ